MVASGPLHGCHGSFYSIILMIKIFVAKRRGQQQQRYLKAFKSSGELSEFRNVDLGMQHSDYSSSHK